MQQKNRHEHAIEMKTDSAVTMELTLAPLQRRRVRAEEPLSGPPEAPNRIPRITRLMALAIKFQQMVDRGEVRNYADLARFGHVSRARITQIMNLLNLAPDIQEQLLDLRGGPSGREAPCERHVRKLAGIIGWPEQREFWRNCKPFLQ